MKIYIRQQHEKFENFLTEGKFDDVSNLIEQMNQNATKLEQEPGVLFIKNNVDEMHKKRVFFFW